MIEKPVNRHGRSQRPRFDVANANSSAVIIRNQRYHSWAGRLIFVLFATVVLTVVGLALDWLPAELGILALAASGSLVVLMMMTIVFTSSMGIGQRWISYPVRWVRLGASLETSPMGLRYRPASISQITFGPDPAEDYADSLTSMALCQASLSMREAGSFQLIVSCSDAARLRRWARENSVRVNDPEGYASLVDQ